MGKPTGFMEWPRQLPPRRHPTERLQDFREYSLPASPDDCRRQAGRCMDCGVPFCHEGCPLGNPIPDFNDAVWRGRWREAWLFLSSTNCFPEFTGRLCPAPCEASCVLTINRDPVTIEQVEQSIAERAYAEGWVQPQPPTQRSGRHVAVVGSGPAGLAAAMMLNRAGHRVTVYERDSQPGGLLRYGIPDFKLEKSVLDRRLRVLEAEGVEFRCGVDVGTTVGFDRLRAEHHALVLALGARVPRELAVPGRELHGVVQAMDYLGAQNRALEGGPAVPAALDARGKRVIILGGGDTGSDCLGTALRQGAQNVKQVELLARPPELRAAGNPWPQWPLVFRTSASHQEGGERHWALMTERLEGEAGVLRRLHAVGVEPATDDRGRRVMQPQPGSQVSWAVDLLVLATGFTGPDTAAVVAQLGVETDSRGNVKVDAGFTTNVPGVFAAGDASRGASLVVWAIADGRDAARLVDGWLFQRPEDT